LGTYGRGLQVLIPYYSTCRKEGVTGLGLGNKSVQNGKVDQRLTGICWNQGNWERINREVVSENYFKFSPIVAITDLNICCFANLITFQNLCSPLFLFHKKPYHPSS
jgi:hypothetical protein